MSRPVEYDLDDVTEKITHLFWLKGYEGTAISEVVNETGLNTRTMYKLFHDKDGLFEAALTYYRDRFLSKQVELLITKSGIAGVEALIDMASNLQLINGCFFVNALTEVNLISKKSLKIIQKFFHSLEEQVTINLEQAKKEKSITGDPKTIAKLLVCFMHGSTILARQKPSPKEMERMVTHLKQFIRS